MSRHITTDATWREPGTRPAGWQIVISETERNTRAALIDKPAPTTMRDVLRLTAGPSARFISRHARAIIAAVRAYKDAVK